MPILLSVAVCTRIPAQSSLLGTHRLGKSNPKNSIRTTIGGGAKVFRPRVLVQNLRSHFPSSLILALQSLPARIFPHTTLAQLILKTAFARVFVLRRRVLGLNREPQSVPDT